MRKIHLLSLLALMCLNALTQDAVLKKLPGGLAPCIDGYKDPLWYNVELNDIDLFLPDEYPTLDIATWQAVWNDTAIFVIVSVEEDDFCPDWCEPVQPHWLSDKTEIYFDVNDILDDGQGPAAQPNGHYQFAPWFIEGQNTYSYSGDEWFGWYYHYAYNIDATNYIFEYALPLSTLVDEDWDVLVPADGEQIGFDVYILDRDAGESERERAAWVNNATGPTQMESWNNMDDCGILEFSTEEIDYPDSTSKPVPDAIVKKLPARIAPRLDGLPDALWLNVEKNIIEKSFQEEEPTLDLATWQAVWNDTAIFVLVSVEEDDFCPPWCEPPQIDWMADRTEIYLDVNYNLKDAGGPVTPPEGHYVFWPGFTEGEDKYSYSGESYLGWYYHYAYKVKEPDYIFEYAIPFTTLINEDLQQLYPSDGKQIGFDVYVVDRDQGEEIRKRTVWMNDGKGPVNDESWNNMDDCGILEFSTDTIDCSGIIPPGEFITYCNFEDILPKLNALGDDSYEITANPDKDIYNSSDSVVKFYSGSNNTFEGCMIPAGGTFYAYDRTSIKIMFYSTVSGHFSIIPVRSSDSLLGVPVSEEYTQVGLWQELTFEMPEDAFTEDYDYLLVLPYNNGTGIWYFDEISGNASILYGDKVKVIFEVSSTCSDGMGEENYVIVDNYSYQLYDNGKNGDEIAEDNIWTRIIQLEGFKLGIGGGHYLWQPLINAQKLDETELFAVAGQDTLGALYKCIGINEISSSEISQSQIYPVPASDYIYVSDANELKQISIYDIFGKEIRKILNDKSGILEIRVSDIKPGVYIVRLIDRTGNMTTKTLLIK
ncbi:MAG: T9SS type A sorting domain-containing protein [Bacteroidales bacterium]|nr:MAG: T9SS type A sorting domain-containing protein [Bacteroidales bacterium]